MSSYCTDIRIQDINWGKTQFNLQPLILWSESQISGSWFILRNLMKSNILIIYLNQSLILFCGNCAFPLARWLPVNLVLFAYGFKCFFILNTPCLLTKQCLVRWNHFFNKEFMCHWEAKLLIMDECVKVFLFHVVWPSVS